MTAYACGQVFFPIRRAGIRSRFMGIVAVGTADRALAGAVVLLHGLHGAGAGRPIGPVVQRAFTRVVALEAYGVHHVGVLAGRFVIGCPPGEKRMSGHEANLLEVLGVLAATEVTAFATDPDGDKALLGKPIPPQVLEVTHLTGDLLDDIRSNSRSRRESGHHAIPGVKPIQTQIIGEGVVATGAALIERDQVGVKRIMAQRAVGLVLGSRVFGRLQVTLWQPLFSPHGVGKPETDLLGVKQVVRRLGPKDLNGDVVLFVAPADGPGNAEFPDQLLIPKILDHEDAVFLAEHRPTATVRNGDAGKVTQDGLVADQHVHPAVGVALPAFVILRVTFATGLRAYVVAQADVAVPFLPAVCARLGSVRLQ
jgi:hypothetical protein